jgi:hypothetical protein
VSADPFDRFAIARLLHITHSPKKSADTFSAHRQSLFRSLRSFAPDLSGDILQTTDDAGFRTRIPR